MQQIAYALLFALLGSTAVHAQEVIVLGSTKSVIEWLQSENWWGEEQHGQQLLVPKAIITGISKPWQQNSAELPVAQKKEIFYRLMLPLVVNANQMVLTRRTSLQAMDAKLANGESISAEDMAQLAVAVNLLRIQNQPDMAASSSAQLRELIAEILYKLDVIPAGLVLGQAAYESGYATSRFAAEGNALFGQWTYGGSGMVPGEQRKQLGDYRIASFEWPFDSVRGYYINISSNPAYEPFRKLRAQRRAEGKPLSSLDLAQGLTSYSERGQEYVDTLRSIIRVNNLAVADGATFRDEPMLFLVGADGDEAAAQLQSEIEALRASGDVEKIVERMRLE